MKKQQNLDRFKFRAWARKTKSMLNALIVDSDSNEIWTAGGSTYNFDDIILMQCTGLKDKNGKLIYEGDIVKNKGYEILIISWESKHVGINGWEFGTGYTGFVAKTGNDDADDEISGISQTFCNFNYGDTDLYADNFEIIGNIYENPELLNNNK